MALPNCSNKRKIANLNKIPTYLLYIQSLPSSLLDRAQFNQKNITGHLERFLIVSALITENCL